MAPLPGLASIQFIRAGKKKEIADSETPEPLHVGDELIKDYLTKIRNPDRYHPQDIVLSNNEEKLLGEVVSRLKRLSATIGYGNFAVVTFDEARLYARNYASIGDFSRAELDFLEMIYSRDASDYGFYGEKQITQLTQSIKTREIYKVPHSGNYLYRGESLRKFEAITQDLGQEVVLTSGIRGVVKQFYLFLRKADRHGGNLSLASRSLAPPGYSYHATGDFDIGQRGLGEFNFTEQFTSTHVFRRLADQGVIRYRYDRDNMLGVRYEPWHVKL